MTGQGHRAAIRPFREGVAAGVVLLAASSLSILALYRNASRTYIDEVHANLLRIGEAATTVFDVNVLGTIVDPSQQDSPEFEQVAGPLRRILKATKGVKYIWTAALIDDEIYFLVDCAEPGDHDGDGRDDQAKIMEPYGEDAPPELWTALREDRETATAEPYEDEWGTFITGFVPIHDTTGRQIGVVGVDITAEEYVRRLASMRRAALGAGAVALVLSAVAGAAVNLVRRQYLRALVRDQAERERATAALQHERDYTQNILRSMADMLVVIAPDGRIDAVNDATCRSLNYSERELVGQPAARLFERAANEPEVAAVGVISPAMLPLPGAVLCRLESQGSVSNVETSFRTRSGERIPVLLSGAIVRDDGGEIRGIVCLALDTTERKATEQALRESERRFMDVLYASGDAILLIGNNTFIDCNDATARMLGYPTRTEFLQTHPSQLSPPHQPDGQHSFEKAEEMMRLAFERGYHRFEWMHRRASGEDFPVEVSLTPVVHGGRHLLHCVWRDITESKRMEAALRESEVRLRGITDSAQDAIIMMDPRGAISFWNPAAELILGYRAEEVLGQNLHRLLAPERFREAHRKAFPEFLRTGRGPAVGKTLELAARRRDGFEITVALSLSAVNLDGEWHAVGVLRDITNRRHAEDALRREHADKAQLLAAIPSILVGVNHCGFVAQWNAAAETAFGVRAADALGKPLEQCLAERPWAPLLAGVATCYATAHARSSLELSVARADGRESHLEVTISPIADEHDRFSGCLLVGADVTARRELEMQLRQSQRLESVGQLAAGIAHEINTPTQFVSDNVRFLRSVFPKVRDILDLARQLAEAAGGGTTPDDLLGALQAAVKAAKLSYLLEQIPEALADSLEGLERTAVIVRAMKDFAHPGQQSMAPADLNKAIESTITVARNEWKYVADMQLELDPALPLITCLVGDLNQVLLNLVVNAAHAIKDVVGDAGKGKGTITISTAVVGDQVEIRVRDTGTGIPEEHRDRVFDHFFTTKAVGKGTGQGLTIARRVIVEKHGGTLTFETETGRGTTFIMRLPVEREPVAATEQPEDALAHSAG